MPDFSHRDSKLRNGVLRILNGRFSISTWILNAIGLASSTIVLLALQNTSVPAVHAFIDAFPLINATLWALLLMSTAVCKFIGMITKRLVLVKYGAFAAWVLWIFGCVAFTLTSNFSSIFLVAFPLMLFNIYLYLAAEFRETGTI